MFAGQNCVRCDKYFKFEELEVGPETLSICRSCAVRINPANEPNRSCVTDGTEMNKKLIYNRVLIDKCPKCGGVWIDGDEIEILERVSKIKGWSRFAEGLFLGNMIP